MRDNLSLGSLMVISVLAAGASLWGCSNKAGSSDVTPHSDAQDVTGADTGGHKDLGPLDAPDQILDLAWLDLEEQTDNWLEGDCHGDCFGGLYCEEGVMHGLLYGPVPCEGPDDSCTASTWLCLSGVCGTEFCSDDDSFLESLVPEGTPWTPVEMNLEEVSINGEVYYPPHHCTSAHCRYRLDSISPSESFQSFELIADDLLYIINDIPNVTNIKKSEVPVSWLKGVWLDGEPLDPISIALFWVPPTMPSEAGYWRKGFNTGVVIFLADGSTVTVVWMWDEALDGPKLAVSVLPAQGTN